MLSSQHMHLIDVMMTATLLMSATRFALRIHRSWEEMKIGSLSENSILSLSLITAGAAAAGLDNILLRAIVVLALPAVLEIYYRVSIERRKRTFLASFMDVLDSVILSMKAGHSLKSALAMARDRADGFMQQKIQQILNLLSYGRNPTERVSFPVEIISEFSLADRFPHKAIESLARWRERLRMVENFRRKSGQVTAYVKMQTLLLLGLYIALLLFMFLFSRLDQQLDLVFLSALLFTAGTLWLHLGFKRVPWKI